MDDASKGPSIPDEEWCYEDSAEECPTGGWLTGHPNFVTCKTCIERFGLQKEDPDFRQRMHFIGPAGFNPCTREWPHDGPCAHHPRMQPLHLGAIGNWIALDWYDGPIIEIARVTYLEGEPLIEVKAFGWLDKDDAGKVHIRLDRSELLKMLDLIEGEPILDYKDEPQEP